MEITNISTRGEGSMRYSNLMIILQLSIISCLITATISLNYNVTKEKKEEYNLNFTSNDPGFELYQSVGHRDIDFHWGTEQVISEPVPGMDINKKSSNHPAVVMDNGTVHFVWADSNETKESGMDDDIFYKYYDGNKWSELFIVSEPVQGQDNNGAQSIEPDIAVENGEVYIVWEDYSSVYGAGPDADIFYRHFDGTAWSGIMVASEPSQGSDINKGLSYYPAIDVENGKAHIVWHDSTFINGAGTDIDIFYRTHNGVTWSNINIVSEPIKGLDINQVGSYQPRVQVEKDIVHFVWADANNTDNAETDFDIFYRYYNGNIWSEIEVVSEPLQGSNVNDGSSLWPDIRVENDNMYVVWEDSSSVFQASTLETEICYRHYTPAGWSTIEVVSEPVKGTSVNTEKSSNSRVAVEDGNVYIVWEDLNETDGAGPDKDIFCRWFNSNGSKWSRINVLSEPVFGQDTNKGGSGYPSISIWHRKVNVVWTDTTEINGSGTDSDIFYRATFVAPGLTGGTLAPSTGLTNTTFTYTVTYSDVDNEPPEIIEVNINGTNYPMKVFNLTDNCYFDGKIYFFETKLNISSDHSYKFIASDGSYEVQTGLSKGPVVFNTAPVITTYKNFTIYEDEYFEDRFEYWDLDHWQVHTWSLVTNSGSWLEVDASTGLLSGIPTNDAVGISWVNLTVTDEFKDADHINFTIEVINVNDAPVMENADQETAYEDELYEVIYQGYDVDKPAQNLTWNFSSNAIGWLDFNPSNGKLNGTPTNDDTGIYWVNISLTDDIELVYTNFSLTVINTNDPPVITTMDVLTATATFLYSADYDAYDIDPPPQDLEWRLSTNATPWLDINPVNGWLYGTPLKKNVGKFWVNVSVWDIEDGLDFSNFTLTVNPSPNEAPKINFTNVKVSAITGELYWYNFTGSDDRTPLDKFIWELDTNGTWLNLDRATGNLTGTPTEIDIGWCWVNITLQDTENGSSYFNFTIFVGKSWSEEKYPPVLRNGELLNPYDGSDLYVFIVQYYDEDGDLPTRIEVVIDNISYSMWFAAGDPTNGEYEYHTGLSNGIYTFYFIASDGYHTVRTENLTAEVPLKESKSESDDSTGIIIFSVIVIIIVIIVFLFLFLSQRQTEPVEVVEVEEKPERLKLKPRREPVEKRKKDDKIRARLAPVSARKPVRRERVTPPVKRPTVPPKLAAPLPVKPGKRPILFEVKDPESCTVCLGNIKRGLPAIRCSCGKTYHTSCAGRVKRCTKCSLSLSNPESKLGGGLD
jgi:hypothetical protein